MSEQDSNLIISQEELEAAIAEIEAMGPGDETRIPSLDDGRGDHVVPVPVPVPPMTPRAGAAAPREATQPDQAPSPAPGVPTGAQPASSSADQPALAGARPSTNILAQVLGLIRRLWPARRSAGEKPEQPAASEAEPKPTTEAQSSNLPVRLIDVLLDLINRPFNWIPPEARRFLGLAGVVTIIMSLLAAAALPRLMPRDDPITFIHQKRAEQLVTQSQPEIEKPH